MDYKYRSILFSIQGAPCTISYRWSLYIALSYIFMLTSWWQKSILSSSVLQAERSLF